MSAKRKGLHVGFSCLVKQGWMNMTWKGSLSQEQIFQELASHSFFINSTRLHGSSEPPPWVCNPKYGRVCSAFFFQEAIHEVVYFGRPADRGKIALINTKVYLAILRKFLLFFISHSFKVPCAIRIMAISICGCFGEKEVVLKTGIESRGNH